MIRAIARHTVDRKAFALWQFVRFSMATVYFWIGGNYLFGSTRVYIAPTYHLLSNIEPGGIRIHGLILCLLAFTVAARPAFQRQTVYALTATLFYSILTTALIIGGWTIHSPDVTAPAWYLLIAALSFALIVSAPRTVKRPGTRGGGASA